MDKTNIYGNLINKKITINSKSNNIINTSDIVIALDGKNNDKKTIQKVKQLYIKYGEDFLYKIGEFFSIYLYDKKNNILILSRDRMGLKTVYYYIDNEKIYFANDIILLVDNYNIKKEINIDSLSMYFRNHYINPPETIFKNIYKLEHGEYLIYRNNKVITKKYWNEIEQFNTKSKKKIRNIKKIKTELDKMIVKDVREYLKTEKDYGIYISGGIDSSLVAAICAKYSNKKIKTFSIGFYEEEMNEAEKSKKIAQYLGTDHHELYITKEMIIENIKKIPKYYTEPFADISEFPTIVLNEFARKNNIKVAFTGDGADQLFCGSKVYDSMSRIQLARKILNPFNIHINFKNRRLSYIFKHINKDYQSQINNTYYEKYIKKVFSDKGCKVFEQEKDIQSKNLQEKRMILDIGTFMADRVSIKMGIAAKKNNIEIRTPFFDKNIIEYTFQIPHKFKYHKKIKKYILKEILYDYIPKEYFSNNKRGFGIPTIEWLSKYLYEDLRRVSTKEFIEKQKIFNYEEINNLISKINDKEIIQIIWDFYMFQLWYCEYIIKK